MSLYQRIDNLKSAQYSLCECKITNFFPNTQAFPQLFIKLCYQNIHCDFAAQSQDTHPRGQQNQAKIKNNSIFFKVPIGRETADLHVLSSLLVHQQHPNEWSANCQHHAPRPMDARPTTDGRTNHGQWTHGPRSIDAWPTTMGHEEKPLITMGYLCETATKNNLKATLLHTYGNPRNNIVRKTQFPRLLHQTNLHGRGSRPLMTNVGQYLPLRHNWLPPLAPPHKKTECCLHNIP